MIQRKQTLFLVLVFLCGLLASFLNLFTITYYEVEYTMSALGGMTSPEEDLLWPVYLFPSIITFGPFIYFQASSRSRRRPSPPS